MPVNIEINDTHAKLLVEFYIQRLKVLREEIIEREKETKEINATILRLRKANSTSSSQSADSANQAPVLPYSDKWPWVRKIKYAIESEGRPLTTKEIVETLTMQEIGLMFDRKKAVASISSILSTKSSGDNKEFVRIESDSGEFAYDIFEKEAESDADDLF